MYCSNWNVVCFCEPSINIRVDLMFDWYCDEFIIKEQKGIYCKFLEGVQVETCFLHHSSVGDFLMHLLFVPWLVVVGSEWNSPVAMESMGCVRQVVHSPCAGCGMKWPSESAEFVQSSLGHQVSIPSWVRYVLEHCMGEPWWDLLVLGHLCWLAVGVDLHQAGPRNAHRLTGATSRGSRSKRENVPGGGRGTGGRKVGAVFLVPCRLGIAEVWEQVRKRRSCGVMPNTAFCPMRSSCKKQGRSIKEFLNFCLFLWVPKTFPVFIFLSKAPHVLSVVWQAKGWAMLLTGFYKSTQKHLHYMCPNRKHLIYPLVCFIWSYLMPSVLEIWCEWEISSLWWISILLPRKAAAGNSS